MIFIFLFHFLHTECDFGKVSKIPWGPELIWQMAT